MIALTVMLVLGILQMNSNEKRIWTLSCISEVCNGARKVCKLGERILFYVCIIGV